MPYNCFRYGRKDGTVLSPEEFFNEHSDVKLTSEQKKRMEQNLEVQSIQILKKYPYSKDIVLKGYYSTFIFFDERTKEYYLEPLFEIKVRVYFQKIHPIILLYDLKNY